MLRIVSVHITVVVLEIAVELLEEHAAKKYAVVVVVQLSHHEVALARGSVLNRKGADWHTQSVVVCCRCEIKAKGVVLQSVVLAASHIQRAVSIACAAGDLVVCDVVQINLHLVVNLLGKAEPSEVRSKFDRVGSTQLLDVL